jgi:DNA repair exonuclease SbcCD ATPase subunit
LVPELETDLKARQTRIEELNEKQRDTCTRFNAIAAGQPHDKFEELQGLLRNQNTEKSKLTMEKGRLEQQQETAQKAGEEIETLTAQSKLLKAKEWIFTMIRAAFATNGIPQLLIENAAEQLEIAANETLEALDLGVRIQFETLQETKSGTTREALNILIVDEDGARDILTFSGGEQKLLRFVVRAAMLKFQAEREGKKVEVILMDEMFDALDEANCNLILKVIEALAHHFRQVFLVAHAVGLVSRLRTRAYFTKDQGISTVEVQR